MNNGADNSRLETQLRRKRARIAKIDRAIIEQFGIRMGIVLEIGEIKEALGITVTCTDIERKNLTVVASAARKAGVCRKFARRLYKDAVFPESRRLQQDQRHRKGSRQNPHKP